MLGLASPSPLPVPVPFVDETRSGWIGPATLDAELRRRWKQRDKRLGAQLTPGLSLAASMATLAVTAWGDGQFRDGAGGKRVPVSHRRVRDRVAREQALVVPGREPFTTRECCACRGLVRLIDERVTECLACQASERALRQAQWRMDRDRNAAFGILFRFVRDLAAPMAQELVAHLSEVPSWVWKLLEECE